MIQLLTINHLFWNMAIPAGGQIKDFLSPDNFFNTIAVVCPGFTTTANGSVSFLKLFFNSYPSFFKVLNINN
jgi:hypothetical protein